jgi:hypothetical protein
VLTISTFVTPADVGMDKGKEEYAFCVAPSSAFPAVRRNA